MVLFASASVLSLNSYEMHGPIVVITIATSATAECVLSSFSMQLL